MKVTKIIVHPERSIDMGPKGWAKLSAGVEITLGEQESKDKEKIAKAYETARKLVSREMKLQYEAVAGKKEVTK